jgi:GT2 family glycosyltransferase
MTLGSVFFNSYSRLVLVTDKTAGKISIIVVNWNGRKFLDDCLGSLSSQTYSNREIILVDNNSADSSVNFVKEHFPEITVVELTKNRGFTGGNLAGLEAARGDLIALINNDTRAEKTWLENLVRPMLEDNQIGICASKLIVDGTDKIDTAGDGLTSAAVGYKRGLWKDKSNYDEQELVFGACAAAALYRRKMLDEIGFFDDQFFLNDEDTDLNFRAQLFGWRCVYVPRAVVYHKVNASIGRLTDMAVYYHTRNLEFIWIKNLPAALMLRFAHHKIVQELGSFGYLCLRHRKWRAFFRGKIDALRMIPKMLEKRADIQRRKTVSNNYLRSLLTPIASRELLRQKIIQLIHG